MKNSRLNTLVRLVLGTALIAVAVLLIIARDISKVETNSIQVPELGAANQTLSSDSSTSTDNDNTASDATGTSTPSALQIVDHRAVLADKSIDEIEQYIVDSIVPDRLGGSSTKTQMLLVRSVTRSQLPELGLGCLPENETDQEPPFVLAVLKGSFTGSGIPSTAPMPNRDFKYAVVVLDVWAAEPSVIITSYDGGVLRTVLNDPSLPMVASYLPTSCPAYKPGKIPYGAIIPGQNLPPAGDTQPTASEVTPTSVVPLPVSTSQLQP